MSLAGGYRESGMLMLLYVEVGAKEDADLREGTLRKDAVEEVSDREPLR